MAEWPNSARTTVHLHDAVAIGMQAYPECEVGPFVAVKLGEAASLFVHDVAVLDSLAVQVAAAREALAGMLPGQDALPDADQVELVPLVVAR